MVVTLQSLLLRPQGLVRENLCPEQLTSEAARHVPATTYISQIPFFSNGLQEFGLLKGSGYSPVQNKEYSRQIWGMLPTATSGTSKAGR